MIRVYANTMNSCVEHVGGKHSKNAGKKSGMFFFYWKKNSAGRLYKTVPNLFHTAYHQATWLFHVQQHQTNLISSYIHNLSYI